MTSRYGLRLVAAFVIIVLGASAAFAVVSFDAATGTGFIGRGDVIDHPTLGKAALVDLPRISYVGKSRYEQECQAERAGKSGGVTETLYDTAKQGQPVRVTATRDVDARKNKQGQITGYLLEGFVSATSGDSAPTNLCSEHTVKNLEWTPLESTDADGNTVYASVEMVPHGTPELTFRASSTLVGTWAWIVDADTGIGSWAPSQD